MSFVRAIMAFFALGAFSNAAAEGIVSELRGGLAAQSCCGTSQDKEQGVAFNGEVLFKSPEFMRVLGSPRPAIGGYIATDSDATSYGYIGFDWDIDLTEAIFLGGGLGGAIHNGEIDRYNPVVDADRYTNTHFFGCRLHFRTAADLGFRVTERASAIVSWSHISNAGICGDNEGLDHLGMRLGWVF